MDGADVSSIRQGILEKYRRTAVLPTGLFRYPTGEASALGLGYPPPLVAAVPPAIRLAGEVPPPDKAPWSD